MIKDIPTTEEFEQTGIAFLNLGWDSVMDLAFQLEWTSDEFSKEEIALYWEAAKHPLATGLALTHQGMDFLIKAKIADVSPFLLIRGSPREWPKGSHNKDIAFADFYTIDSSELIRAHDTVAQYRLPTTFVQLYEKLRLRRNSVFHTVDRRMGATIKEILQAILEASHLLLGEHKWFQARREYLEHAPASVVYSSDHVGDSLVQEAEKVIQALTRSEAERLLGFYKQRRSYICPFCYVRCYGMRDAGSPIPHLAQLDPNAPQSTNLHCFVCSRDFHVIRNACRKEDCPGNVIGRTIDCPSSAINLEEFERDGQTLIRFTLLEDGEESVHELRAGRLICLSCEEDQ